MKNMPLSRCLFIALLFLTLSAVSVYSQTAKSENLNALIKEGMENNPQIKSVYHSWQAASFKVKEALGLPDPMARYSYFGESAQTRVGPQEHKYGISQKIPFPGKLNLKGKSQGRKAAILGEKYEAIKRQIIKNIKFTYFDIFWVDKAISVTEEEKSILENLEKVAQRKYESNLGPQQDAIKAQVELSRLIDKLFILRQNRESLAAKMNSLLNRPSQAKIGPTQEVKPDEFSYERETLQALAVDNRQELRAANLDIQRAEYEKSLARLNYFPDFTFGLDYIQVGSGHTSASNDGQDAWMGTVAINVPIWFDKLEAQVKEKRSALESSRENLQNTQNSVAYEVDDLYFKIMAYKDIVSLYRTALIPQTEQAFEAARIAYETGEVDFLNWLDAERILLQTHLAYYKAIIDYRKSIAYLERVVGKDL